MSISRRHFLAGAGAGTVGALTGLVKPEPSRLFAASTQRSTRWSEDWLAVRDEFEVDPRWVHLAGLLLAAHPRPVRDAIELHRRNLDANPVHYMNGAAAGLESGVRQAAAGYLGARPSDIALTESTTMGLAMMYNGLHLRAGDEVVTTTHDHRVTRESLQFKAERSGARINRIPLYRDAATASAAEILESLTGAIGPRTRAAALTWVHSSTGVKLPIRELARAIEQVNSDREPAERVLLFVDGVHALGVEADGAEALGCDFLIAGTHKWLFGPRGTGIVWGHPRAQARIGPTIPSFTRDGTWGGEMSPGGFQAFDHRWALSEAFKFHEAIGKRQVQERIHSLNSRLKEGLADMAHVRMHTPLSPELSSGMVCFEVEGLTPRDVVWRLRERRIIASQTPYSPTYARLAPGLLNTPEDVDTAIREVAAIG